MGPLRTRQPARPVSRGRFQEGSMNDRASAVPPVHFLGAAERAALGLPADVDAAVRPGSQHGGGGDGRSHSNSSLSKQPKEKAKRGSRLLGQMWDKLRFKKDVATEEEERTGRGRKGNRWSKDERLLKDERPSKEERPSKDDIFENYQQLVNSGFFSSHAIQSARQPAPQPPSRRSASRPPTTLRPPPSHTDPQRPSTANAQSPPPQWPLPAIPRAADPSMRSPNSASRGTKRAAPAAPGADDEDAPQSASKKLRKSASRDMAPPPKLRTASSRRALLPTRRSASLADAPPLSREPNKLTKRGTTAKMPTAPVPDRNPSARRNVSEAPAARRSRMPLEPSTRVLRPRQSAEPLRMMPSANQSIPRVPNIPDKFTYGEDRENNGPWRGLRR